LWTKKKKYTYECAVKEGYGLTTEFIPKDHNNLKDIFGFKVGGFGARNYSVFGFQFGYFTNFNKYKVCFIPEIGLGYKSLFIVYRRNIRLFGDGIENINKDNISVRLYVPIGQGWLKK
jgi:hypothetical protein